MKSGIILGQIHSLPPVRISPKSSRYFDYSFTCILAYAGLSMEINPESPRVFEGEEVIIQCRVTPKNPPPQISWSRTGQVGLQDTFRPDGSIIVLPEIKMRNYAFTAYIIKCA